MRFWIRFPAGTFSYVSLVKFRLSLVSKYYALMNLVNVEQFIFMDLVNVELFFRWKIYYKYEPFDEKNIQNM